MDWKTPGVDFHRVPFFRWPPWQQLWKKTSVNESQNRVRDGSFWACTNAKMAAQNQDLYGFSKLITELYFMAIRRISITNLYSWLAFFSLMPDVDAGLMWGKPRGWSAERGAGGWGAPWDWHHELGRSTRDTWPLKLRDWILRWQIFEICLFQSLFLSKYGSPPHAPVEKLVWRGSFVTK